MRDTVRGSQPRRRRHRRTVWCDSGSFRETRLCLFLTQAATADLLRVTVRTIRNWESGAGRVPYPAYKLLRVLRGLELPGPAWKGWSLSRDALVSPEGHSFHPWDMTWWSLTCAMARLWREDHRRRAGAGPGRASATGRAPARPGLVSYKTSDTPDGETPQNKAFSAIDAASIWPHYGPTLAPLRGSQDAGCDPDQAQSAAAPGATGGGADPGRSARRVPECPVRDGHSEPRRLSGQSPRRRRRPASSSRRPGARAFYNKGHAYRGRAAGRRQRPVSLRKRYEVQALPRPAGLTGEGCGVQP
jgi:hypothetical protein